MFEKFDFYADFDFEVILQITQYLKHLELYLMSNHLVCSASTAHLQSAGQVTSNHIWS